MLELRAQSRIKKTSKSEKTITETKYDKEINLADLKISGVDCQCTEF